MVIYVCIKFQEKYPKNSFFKLQNGKAEFYSSCVSAPCLIMLLHLCEVFIKNIIFQTYRAGHKLHGRNDYFSIFYYVQKGGNYRSGLTRATVLVFCTSSHCDFTFVRNFMKISQKRLSIYRVVTSNMVKNGYVQCSKGSYSKKWVKPDFMVHEFCILSHGALNLCEVFLKNISNGFPTYRNGTLVHGRNGYFSIMNVSKGP